MADDSKRLTGRAAVRHAFVASLLLGFALAAAGCGGGAPSSGPTGRIAGKIQDANGMAVSATVTVDGVVYHTVAGVYQTDNLAYGVHQVVVAAEGFQGQTTSVNLQSAVRSLSFTLSREPDLTRPEVVAFYPEPGATGVYRDAKLLFSFSEAMNQVATAAVVTIDPAVGLTFTWDDETHLVAAPTAALDPAREYTVTLGTGAGDLAGNTLAAPYMATFHTGSTVMPTSRIAFAQMEPKPRLMLMGPEPASQAVAFLPGSVDDSEPAWSPDGRHLVFASRRAATDQNPQHVSLYVTQIDVPNPVPVFTGKSSDGIGVDCKDVEPKWSPAGDRLALISVRTGVSNLWTVTVDEQGKALPGGLDQITQTSSATLDINDALDVSSPEWSADGTLLVFSATPKSRDGHHIYATDARGGEVAGRPVDDLTPDGVEEEGPAWWTSPGGRHKVAYASYRNNNWDLWVVEVSVWTDWFGNRRLSVPNAPVQLTHTTDFNERNPVWSPDGQYLIFVGERSGQRHLYRTRVQIGEVLQVDQNPELMTTGTRDEDSPAWSRQ